MNKNVILKNEYLEERKLLSECVTFDTTASIEDILEQIRLIVEPVTE